MLTFPSPRMRGDTAKDVLTFACERHGLSVGEQLEACLTSFRLGFTSTGFISIASLFRDHALGEEPTDNQAGTFVLVEEMTTISIELVECFSYLVERGGKYASGSGKGKETLIG